MLARPRSFTYSAEKWPRARRLGRKGDQRARPPDEDDLSPLCGLQRTASELPLAEDRANGQPAAALMTASTGRLRLSGLWNVHDCSRRTTSRVVHGPIESMNNWPILGLSGRSKNIHKRGYAIARHPETATKSRRLSPHHRLAIALHSPNGGL